MNETSAARERLELPAAVRWTIAIATPPGALIANQVLVAEDNELTSELMQQLLLSRGHEVIRRVAVEGRS